ncbi:MAG: amidase domain-containing protein [Bacteroides sp.]|nr:amidase domain-containing protein [Bacteroides sp.]
MKHRGLAAVFAGLVAFLIAMLLILYFDPFKSILDRVFVIQEEPPLSSVEYVSMWHNEEEAAELPELKAVIDRYFECFYSALGDKEFEGERVLEDFFMDSCSDCVYDLAALSSCAYRLSASNIDLTLTGVRAHIWLGSVIKINKDGYIFTLKQSAELFYKALKGIGSGEGIYSHTFIFERIGGSWYLSYHEADGGAWKYAAAAMNELCGASAPSYTELYSSYPEFLRQLGKHTEDNAELIRTSGYDSAFPSVEIEYNREAAAEYAARWTSIVTEARNTEVWDDYANDSGNFVSQCIYSGVKHMDTQGTYIWKWFDGHVNYNEENKGCSMSWTEGDNLWLYCTANDNRGLCTVTDAAGGQIEKGDIVQLVTAGSVMSQAVVTDVVTDLNGRKLDFLVSGHDSDLVSYPLSALHCSEIRFIKVLGYNTET